jgi:hypothetical protein
MVAEGELDRVGLVDVAERGRGAVGVEVLAWSPLMPAERSAAIIDRFGPSTFGAVMWKASAPMPKPTSSA